MEKLRVGDKVKIKSLSYTPRATELGTESQFLLLSKNIIEIESIFIEGQQRMSHSGLVPITVEKAVCKTQDINNNIRRFVYLTKYLILDKRESL